MSLFPDIPGLSISLYEDGSLREDTIIKNKGEGNRIVLEQGAVVGSLGRPKIEFLGSGNTLWLSAGCKIKRGHYRFTGDGNVIFFGPKSTVNGAYLLCDGGSKISIGTDCMLSYDIEMRTTDAHSILDVKSEEVLNPPQDIIIGDHCWIGKAVCILQGVCLPRNCIVGTRTLVTRSFTQENAAIAGIPAKVVKRGVSWKRDAPRRE